MMQLVRSTTIALLMGLLLTGCGSQEGETIVTAGPTNPDVAVKAPETGTYTLYSALSPNPTVTVKLKEGDALGFRGAGDGKIEAYAGDQTHTFNKGTSQVYWKYVNE